MRRARRAALLLMTALAALFLFGPYEPVETGASFNPARFAGGVQAYFDGAEAGFDDIRPDSAKRVIWAGEPETRTPLALVYLHGFSASSQEIRPVPDNLARALGANLVFTRLRGHGRDSEAMAEGSVQGWMQDAAEALAAGRASGEEVILLSTSTGGTIAALALLDPTLSERVRGAVFISPNFGINNPMAPLLSFPAARHWLPLFAGQRRSFEPRNPGQAAHWTTEYPSVAVFQMAAMVRHAQAQDYGVVNVPALFYFSDADQVVRPDLTREVMARWGGEVTHIAPMLTETVDSYAHVVAGDILSPGNTAAATEAILSWIRELN